MNTEKAKKAAYLIRKIERQEQIMFDLNESRVLEVVDLWDGTRKEPIISLEPEGELMLLILGYFENKAIQLRAELDKL